MFYCGVFCVIDVPSVLCPVCDEVYEDISHIFLVCEMVSQVWQHIEKWLDLPFSLSGMEAMKALEVIFLTIIQMHWRYRNNVVLWSTSILKCNVYENIVVFHLIGSQIRTKYLAYLRHRCNKMQC